jgi:DNA-binding Lrp family transcriptional regulator
MAAVEFRLLNDFQRLFPLVPEPYAVLAEALGVAEADVLERLARLRASGAVSRVGAVFRPGAIGASTLAAMAVPPERLEAVATVVSRFLEVNHNYERDHRYNLWFVAAAPDEDALEAVLDRIERTTGIDVIALPLVEEYHIDLGFPLDRALRTAPDQRAAPRTPTLSPDVGGEGARAPARVPLDDAGKRLVAALEDGLELVTQPYAALAARAGLDEREVIDRLARWLDEGVIRRFGVVVRHHELGYRANAMTVWDVPDEAAPAFGRALAAAEGVTLAYRRARHLPEWSYNLYCMLHGIDRGPVWERLDTLTRSLGLDSFPRAVLFSQTRFKQTGARVASLVGNDPRGHSPSGTPKLERTPPEAASFSGGNAHG